MRIRFAALVISLLVSGGAFAQQPLEIFQDLGEATLRIPRL